MKKTFVFLLFSFFIILIFPSTIKAATTGDVNLDGVVNIVDIGIIIDNYAKIPITVKAADINSDGEVNIIDIGLTIDNYGKGNSATNSPIPTGQTVPGQMFITKAELMTKPTSGAGWTYLKSRADANWATPNLGDQFSITQSDVLAAALVYARDPAVNTSYRTKVINQLKKVCGSEAGAAQLLNLARTLYGYVVAADMVQMDYQTQCANGETWLHFLQRIRTHVIVGQGSSLWTTLENCSKYAGNNWGSYALSSHLAVSYALNDTAMINRDIEIFKRYLGDTTSAAAPFVPGSGYNMNGNGATWDMTPVLKRGINPPDPANPKRGNAIIEDSLRKTGGAGDSVPCCEPNDVSQGYQAEALDGILSTAQLLRAHGVDMTNFQDKAMLRAFIHWQQAPPPHYSSAYWKYIPYAINYLYGTNYPTSGEAATPYRHMGFGTWLFTR